MKKYGFSIKQKGSGSRCVWVIADPLAQAEAEVKATYTDLEEIFSI